MFFRRWLQHNAKFIIAWLEKFIPQEPRLALITFTATTDGEEVVTLAETQVQDDVGQLTARVSFKDVHGHDTAAEDVPTWTSSDESVVSLEVAEDGLSATATVNAPGASLIEVTSMTADGDEIKAQGTVTVTAGEPASGEVTFEEGAASGGTEEPPAEEAPA
jgi:uncharacterized protein YjdB